MQPAPISAEVIRELTDADLASIVLRPAYGSSGNKTPAVKRLRERHHKLARLLAEGVEDETAATCCNYTTARVQQLREDPSFRDLITFYRSQVEAEFVDFQKRLAEIGMDAAEVLLDRIEDAPDEIETRDLVKIIALGADRTGHGPKATQDVHISFGSRLEAAKARLKAVSTGDVIDGQIIKDE